MKTWQALLLLAPAASAQSTWYVDASGTPPGIGTQADPYTSIQYAIDQAATLSGDTLRVRSGTYDEALDLGSKDLRITGLGATAPLIDAGGVGSAVTIAGGQTATLLRDLEITGGVGTAIDQYYQAGGGLFVEGAAVELEDVVVRDCRASLGGGIALRSGSHLDMSGGSVTACWVDGGGSANGGGIYIDAASSALVQDAEFVDNRAGLTYVAFSEGAAIYSEAPASNLTVTDSLFHDNGSRRWEIGFSTLGYGGAAAAAGRFVRCVFTDNDAQVGGALAYGSSEDCVFENNVASADGLGEGGGAYGGTHVRGIFRANQAAGYGGAASVSTLIDCLVVDNHNYTSWDNQFGSGGGLYDGTAIRTHFEGNRVDPTVFSAGGAAMASTLVDCTIVDNVADQGGGVWRCTLDHCTVYANHARVETGGCHQTWQTPQITSSIIFGNTPDQLDSHSLVTHSAVEGGWPGVGNTAADPEFWSKVQPDLHLRPGSPCIGTAEGGSDMGALAFDPNYFGESGSYCVAKQTSAGCVPSIDFSGTPSLSLPGTFTVTAHEVMGNTPGVLFWGLAPHELPFMGGTLCVAGPHTRSAVMFSSGSFGACDGSFAYDMDAAFFSSLGLVAGDGLYAQYWYRDPAHTDGTGVGLTDGLEILVQP